MRLYASEMFLVSPCVSNYKRVQSVAVRWREALSVAVTALKGQPSLPLTSAFALPDAACNKDDEGFEAPIMPETDFSSSPACTPCHQVSRS